MCLTLVVTAGLLCGVEIDFIDGKTSRGFWKGLLVAFWFVPEPVGGFAGVFEAPLKEPGASHDVLSALSALSFNVLSSSVSQPDPVAAVLLFPAVS